MVFLAKDVSLTLLLKDKLKCWIPHNSTKDHLYACHLFVLSFFILEQIKYIFPYYYLWEKVVMASSAYVHKSSAITRKIKQ